MDSSRAQPTTRPLSSWRFTGRLRTSQLDLLERLPVDTPDRTLHIVAPPGSGKTLLGLELAMRDGRRAVVFTPTTAIRAQWAEAARALVPEEGDTTGAVSEDPATPGDLTALSYQVLSVRDARAPLEPLAHEQWREELIGEGRTPENADAWLGQLRVSAPDAYRKGVARRSRAVRRSLARRSPQSLLAGLHSNARDLVERLVATGVGTIILDECHHLLDHWALVVSALVARLREAGHDPLVIGLTATLPSPDDAEEYENYTSLLGEVDGEIPLPAVVREGNLAPYRDLVRFTEPDPDELAFLQAHAEGLQVLIRQTFARGDGLDYLVELLQPAQPTPPPEPDDPLVPPGSARAPATDSPPPAPATISSRLADAFAADFGLAESAAAMLATVAPTHVLVAALPDDVRRPPSGDEAIRLLGRWALDRVLPDAGRADQWERIRRTLADFGYALTDTGMRRTRDPIDTMLTGSIGKDHAAVDILTRERELLGERLRALVVTDFAVHGNRHGGAVGAAGALRTFDVLTGAPAMSGLPALLVTSSVVRAGERDAADLARALAEDLGAAVEVGEREPGASSRTLSVAGVGHGRVVRAAARLMGDGRLRVVVGTRGMFGEGWDCPAVNTLIDLTAVATASATQQLRGRTLRLDPSWPEKVAHNWTVTAMLPSSFPLTATPDLSRLTRKHARLWGLDRDRPEEITRGLPIVLPARERAATHAGDSAADLNAALDAVMPPRAVTAAQWQVGALFEDREEVRVRVPQHQDTAVFRAARRVTGAASGGLGIAAAGVGVGATVWGTMPGPAGAVVGGLIAGAAVIGAVAPVAALRQSLGPSRGRSPGRRSDTAYAAVAATVWEGLRRAGRVSDVAEPGIRVEGETKSGTVAIVAQNAPLTDQRVLAGALAELFGPVRTPRFLLEVGTGGAGLVGWLLARTGNSRRGRLLAVPGAIGRRREDALAFSQEWNARIGPAVLHELSHPAKLTLALEAREGDARAAPAVEERWR